MAKGLPRSLSRGSALQQDVVKQSIAIDSTLTITGATGSADGGTFVIAGLPQGNILFLGAAAYVEVDATGDAEVIDNWAGDYAVGTVPNADSDLGDPGEADVIPSTALIAGASDKIAPSTRGLSTSSEHGIFLDNTAGDLELNLNLLTDDGVITNTQDGTFAVSGVLHIVYSVLGDN